MGLGRVRPIDSGDVGKQIKPKGIPEVMAHINQIIALQQQRVLAGWAWVIA
jgi:hypothetical protein